MSTRALPRTVVLALALAALPAALPRAAAAEPALREVTLRSEVFGGDRVALVLLPPGAGQPGRRFPVLYFADGDRLMPTIAATMRVLVDAGLMPDLILVGLRHADRTYELTPTSGWMPTPGGRREVPGSGGADRLLAHLEREVIPAVERTFPVEPLRLLAGHSLGGLFTLHVLATRPSLFGGWLAVSPTVAWEGDLPARRLKAALAATPAPRGVLVVTLGEEGPIAAAALAGLEQVLGAAPPSLTTRLHRFEGEDHGTVVLPSFSRGLRELFPGWRLEVAEGAVGPKGGLAAVERHYRALSERLGYQVPLPEALVNLAGYQALQDGQPEEALRAFQRNRALHPASPNVHDSLGEAFERGGDLKAAAACYQRAWELAEQQGNPRTPIFRRNALRAAAALAR
jgi:predicted alpha/beta superfamily hydrolase